MPALLLNCTAFPQREKREKCQIIIGIRYGCLGMKTGMSYSDKNGYAKYVKHESCFMHSLEVVVGVPFKGDSKVDQDWYKFFL